MPSACVCNISVLRVSACCLCGLPQAEVSNGDGGAAVKTSGRISAVVSLMISMGAELESDRLGGNAAADHGASGPSGLPGAAELGAGASEAPDDDSDDFDDFEEAEDGTSRAAADTAGTAAEEAAPAQDAATHAATGRDDPQQEALDPPAAHHRNEHAEDSGSGMQEAEEASEASEKVSSSDRPAEGAVLEEAAVVMPVVGISSSSSTSADLATPGSSGRRASGNWGARERCLTVRHPLNPFSFASTPPVSRMFPVACPSVLRFESGAFAPRQGILVPTDRWPTRGNLFCPVEL